jgi:hypothetical protein
MYYYTSFLSTYSTGAFGGKKVSALSEQTGTAASYSAGTLISHPRHQPSTCTSCRQNFFFRFISTDLGANIFYSEKAKRVLGVCSSWPFVPLAASELVWRRPTAPRHERSITGHSFLCGAARIHHPPLLLRPRET